MSVDEALTATRFDELEDDDEAHEAPTRRFEFICIISRSNLSERRQGIALYNLARRGTPSLRSAMRCSDSEKLSIYVRADELLWNGLLLWLLVFLAA
jgi:hypothetical protein